MKQNELKEFKQKSDVELMAFLSESRAHLRSLQFDLAQGKVKNVGEIRTVRKAIARALTLLRMRNNVSK